MARALTNGRPAAIYLMPTFHNPTGALLAANRRRDLAELVVEHGVPLIEDNALENAPLDDERLPPISAYAPPDAPGPQRRVVQQGRVGRACGSGGCGARCRSSTASPRSRP